jgi:hypothetical protein
MRWQRDDRNKVIQAMNVSIIEFTVTLAVDKPLMTAEC